MRLYLKGGHLKLHAQSIKFLKIVLYPFQQPLLELLFFSNHKVQQTLGGF